MRSVLLTWYGVTDLRASLGVGNSDGPVLSALRSGGYSDVVILGYTDPAKEQHPFRSGLREDWEELVTAPGSVRLDPLDDRVHRLVTALGNTADGHSHFEAWLQNRLTALGVSVAIRLIPTELDDANDAVGIYRGAVAALREVVRGSGESRITTHLSPGTPVMAYTWALLARSNPHLRLEVIAGSNPLEPPKSVNLPRALLDGPVDETPNRDPGQPPYDLVIHLLGQEKMPVLFGLRQFKTERTVIITTDVYEADARRLARHAGATLTPVVISDPFKPAATRRAIEKQVAKLQPGARVAVNMTGGTKLMFAGALSACWELGLEPFYFEISHHDVIFLRDGSKVPFVGLDSVDDFLVAAGFHATEPIQRGDRPESATVDRLRAANELWRMRSLLKGLYRDSRFRTLTETPKSGPAQRSPGSGSFSWVDGVLEVHGGRVSKLELKGNEIELPMADGLTFVAGGWLEEHVYSLFRALEEDGTIRDLRLNVNVDKLDESSGQWPLGELDLAFTDRKRLWIVECKAGQVRQEAVQKLENNVKLYGGVAARGLIVSGVPIPSSQQKRVNTLHSITAVASDELTTDRLRTLIRSR